MRLITFGDKCFEGVEMRLEEWELTEVGDHLGGGTPAEGVGRELKGAGGSRARGVGGDVRSEVYEPDGDAMGRAVVAARREDGGLPAWKGGEVQAEGFFPRGGDGELLTEFAESATVVL